MKIHLSMQRNSRVSRPSELQHRMSGSSQFIKQRFPVNPRPLLLIRHLFGRPFPQLLHLIEHLLTILRQHLFKLLTEHPRLERRTTRGRDCDRELPFLHDRWKNEVTVFNIIDDIDRDSLRAAVPRNLPIDLPLPYSRHNVIAEREISAVIFFSNDPHTLDLSLRRDHYYSISKPL